MKRFKVTFKNEMTNANVELGIDATNLVAAINKAAREVERKHKEDRARGFFSGLMKMLKAEKIS